MIFRERFRAGNSADEKCVGAGGLRWPYEESRNPRPVFDAGPSTLGSLFHPNASTVVEVHCRMISAMLNLG
jgi:hypothetical protein